jgi:hypothetical protein
MSMRWYSRRVQMQEERMRRNKPGFGVVTAGMLLLVAAASPPVAKGVQPQLTPLVADVLSPPQAVRGPDGAEHLVYELRIENITDGRFTLERIAVTDERGATLAQLDAQAVGTRFALGGRRGSETNILESSQFGVAFLHVTIAASVPVPTSLTHVIDGHSEKAQRDFSLRIAKTNVIAVQPPSLAAPLRGEGYVVGDGCCDSIRHVRALLPLDGHSYLAQRFAIDWERVDRAGRVFTGNPKSVRSYRIYDEPVFAVADGTVIAARNDLGDQLPGRLPEGLPLDEADGNFAIIGLGNDAYALYAHMRRGSVTVSAGQRVHRGEQIGNVGNSGNTQAPHLHFQLMDAPSALAANGLPYVFEHYTVTAVDAVGTADFDRAEATGTPMRLRRKKPPIPGQASLPLDLSILTWK